jgi:Domain of unknown function (DUF4169)
MSGDVINLRRVRKRKAREAAAREADVNRARFGRSKDERALSDLERARGERQLDQAVRDTPSADRQSDS